MPYHYQSHTTAARSVLLVEDNPAHAHLVQRCFEELQVKNDIYHVQDGKAALAYLLHQGRYANACHSPRPQLILLDLRLPKISGLDVLKHIKADTALSSIPVVVLTTSNAERDIEQAYARGANDYKVKPDDFDAFSVLIEDIGMSWLADTSLPHCEKAQTPGGPHS